MNNSSRFLWIVFSLLSMFFCFAAFDAFSYGKYFTGSVFLVAAFVSLAFCWNLLSKKLRDADKLISAIRQKDFSLFPKETKNDSLKNNAVKLYYQAKQEHTELYSYKNLYDTILNKLEIGFLILNKKTTESQWKVFYCNPSFLTILKVPRYNLWQYYQEKIPEFYALIQQTEFKDSQEFIDISIQESSRKSYSIRTSGMTTSGTDFCIVSLESIQKIIDQKEKHAWNNLMKVISHELLNTLTPVSSLIDNLEYLTQQEHLTQEDQSEIRESLKIINSKSQQLLHFIESYRQIAELPKPKKNRFNLNDCVLNVLKIFEPEFRKEQIAINLNAKEIWVHADEKMMERVLVNVLTNAQFALQNREEKQIKITIAEQQQHTTITIEDNGEGVDSEIENKIFQPFFTTRNNGSGIGLTLAKSILEAHHGYLTYKRLAQGSAFEVWLP